MTDPNIIWPIIVVAGASIIVAIAGALYKLSGLVKRAAKGEASQR
jgi:formyltetrahydrofolate synthetase